MRKLLGFGGVFGCKLRCSGFYHRFWSRCFHAGGPCLELLSRGRSASLRSEGKCQTRDEELQIEPDLLIEPFVVLSTKDFQMKDQFFYNC